MGARNVSLRTGSDGFLLQCRVGILEPFFAEFAGLCRMQAEYIMMKYMIDVEIEGKVSNTANPAASG